MVNPSDLLVLLAVARARTHMGAAAALGINHTTVARRLKALEHDIGERLLVQGPAGWELTAAGRMSLEAAEGVEKAMLMLPGAVEPEDRGLRGVVRISSTEIFGLLVVVPAVATIREEHPRVAIELASITRPGPPYGPAVDLEIGVTKPPLARMERRKLVEYELGLFATKSYLEARGTPATVSDLADHTPIYYIESMLEIADMDLVDRLFGSGSQVLSAMSVLAQLEMTKRSLGIGLLPDFLAVREPTLERVLIDEAKFPVTYWMSGRSENLRRPEVRALAEAIGNQTRTVFGASGG